MAVEEPVPAQLIGPVQVGVQLDHMEGAGLVQPPGDRDGDGVVAPQHHRQAAPAAEQAHRGLDVAEGLLQIAGDIVDVAAVHHRPLLGAQVVVVPFWIIGTLGTEAKAGGLGTYAPGAQPGAGAALDSHIAGGADDSDVSLDLADVRADGTFGKGGDAGRGHVDRGALAEILHKDHPFVGETKKFLSLLYNVSETNSMLNEKTFRPMGDKDK